MLVIRQKQMDSLSEYCSEQFVNRVFIHVSELFPDKVYEIGDAGVRQTIRSGVNRAGEYGFSTEYDVVRYIDLMFVFGANFDRNPGMLSLTEILHDDSYSDPTSKMDHIVEVATEYSDEEKE